MVVEEIEVEGREVEKDVDRHLQLSATGQNNLRAQVPCSGSTGVEVIHTVIQVCRKYVEDEREMLS